MIINGDGSVFHLHVRPEHLADKVILVGDPGRVDMIGAYLSDIESSTSSREFHSVTGKYKGVRMTVLSTGIGCDNIDIVMNELDALANVDFNTREVRSQKRSLTILRIGTCGVIQPDEEAFLKHVQWDRYLPTPYFVKASERLADLFADSTVQGMTVSAPGFYGPQCRVVRLPLVMPDLMERLESFRFGDMRITNFEMEGSAIASLSRKLGHEGATVCLGIAQRYAQNADADYKSLMGGLIELCLDKLAQ